MENLFNDVLRPPIAQEHVTLTVDGLVALKPPPRGPRARSSRTPLHQRKRIRDHLAHVRRREPQAAHDALDAAGEPALVQDDGRLDLHALHGARALDAEPHGDAARDEGVLVGPRARRNRARRPPSRGSARRSRPATARARRRRSRSRGARSRAATDPRPAIRS